MQAGVFPPPQGYGGRRSFAKAEDPAFFSHYNHSVRSCAILCALGLSLLVQSGSHTERITWDDLAPLHGRLESRGITKTSFDAYVDRVREDNARRVREGDLDHLMFYALQSTRFTRRPPIEPALSAKALIESGNTVPADVRGRIGDLLEAIDSSSDDPRLVYFHALLRSAFPTTAERETNLLGEYTRVMKFVYDKEFVAQRSGPDAVVELYRSRGLSTDTEVEAGYVVYNGLGVLKSLDPARRIRRVLIVGPGLDLAPRTGLLDTNAPQSYQPWAVIDALVSLGLSRIGELTVVGADINPRVVDHLRRADSEPPRLTLVSGIEETIAVHFAKDYRDYFGQLGRSIGDVTEQAPPKALTGHLSKTVRIRRDVAHALSAAELDVVTARLEGPPFDLIIATNILPYFDDAKLMLALTNIETMLALDGIFMHNESRPLLGELTHALGMPFEQSRQVTIASVTGAPPLADTVWVHRRSKSQ
jgi:hypothetical protein